MGNGPAAVLRTAMAALAVTLALAAVAPAASAIPSPCTLTLHAADTSLEFQVTSAAPDAAQTVVNYTLTKPDPTRAQLTFTAEANNGWVSTVSPASITITNQVAGTITLTVVAPAGSPTTNVGSVTVHGTLTVSGLQCQGDSEAILLTPLPYLDEFSASVAPTNITLKNGAATAKLELGAKSNAPVDITLTYEVPDGATLTASAQAFLPQNDKGQSNTTVSMSLRAPTTMEPGTYPLRVHVHAQLSDGTTKDAVATAQLTVPPPPDAVTVAISYAPLIALGAVGAAAFVWWRRR